MTDKDEKVNRLADTGIFRSVPRDHLIQIAEVLKEKKLPAKTAIFRRGDPGDSFYIINSGKVRVLLRSEDGIVTDLNLLHPGDSFGEMALLTGESRSTDIETLDETHLFILTKEEFEKVLEDHPDVLKDIIKHISEMLKRDDRRIQKEAERDYQTIRISFFDFIFIGALILVLAGIFNLSNPNSISIMPELYDPDEIPRIDPLKAKIRYDEGEVIFVDARPANFYNERQIKGAVNLPLSSFEINYMYMQNVDKQKGIIVYGRSISGLYDEAVARLLQLYGHENVQILDGGSQYLNLPLKWVALDAWQRKGYPVEAAGDE